MNLTTPPLDFVFLSLHLLCVLFDRGGPLRFMRPTLSKYLAVNGLYEKDRKLSAAFKQQAAQTQQQHGRRFRNDCDIVQNRP